ncbi:ABC transporter permease [Aliiruegeria lutimaris]|uniref:ABC-2 type transport system permease protein n=1 Tax=Aliiruegeria lutimaris TaxID=571298 RepID=A0A1G8YKM9_9RHOB|nr:ABC transporter permease [Aliiruegeria lutimaris]SDK03432.1 ABC-2 type transport system permease protein [Aliiruegeria lutimaris]
MNPRRFMALLIKESRQILRDPSTFLIALVLPLILLFLFGTAVSLDVREVRIGLALEDDSAVASSLGMAFRNSRWFDVTFARELASLEPELVAGKLRGIIVIPQDFGARMESGQAQATIQIITDGSLPNTASFVANYAQGVQTQWAQGEALDHGVAAERPINLIPRFWFNPELTSRDFLIPGSIAIVMSMIGTLLTALVVAREWERGTMEALMATPVAMSELLASKVLPYFILGLGSVALCTGLAVFVFGVPFRGSIPGLLAVSSAFLVPALGQGLLISAIAKNQFVASQMALLIGFLPSMVLSGFIFEIASMPVPIQIITYAVPARYLVPSLQTLFTVGDIWPMFLHSIAILLGFGLIYFALAIRVTHRRIA